MKSKLFCCVLLSLVTTGCTSFQTRVSTQISDSPATISCYSGGKQILEAETVGKPVSENNSDGYLFKDKATGKLVEISADCIIVYK